MTLASTTKLVEQLKEAGEDLEFYPSSKEMLDLIYDNMDKQYYVKSILDIGCGTCNFTKFYKPRTSDNKFPYKYYAMEKSKILIDRLDKDVILLGTDFNQSTLIDKEVSCIFSNPPYSEYEQWMTRIILEGNCDYIYLIVPERWKDNKDIVAVLNKVKAEATVLGSFDFLHAERPARAKVDVLLINKRHSNKDVAFDSWFDETFPMRNKTQMDVEVEDKKEKLKNALVSGENKVEILVTSYQNEQRTLFEHFTAISNLDIDILESIGVSKSKVKESLKLRIKGLKNIYWDAVFENMSEITNRLTRDSRRRMLEKFTGLKQVDFTAQNIYSLIVWVVKNSNSYYDEQLTTLFKNLSSEESVTPYKSNQSTFKFDRWRYNTDDKEAGRYTLDYRIVSRDFDLKDSYSWTEGINNSKVEGCIGDICTVANNLGFKVGEKTYPSAFGKPAHVLLEDGKVLFEYRTHKNRNTHFKMNKELIKAINVEASRLLGWIRGASDIKEEFCEEMAEGAEKYFKTSSNLQIGNSMLMLGCSNEI